MTHILSDYPIFGSEIQCPQCHRTIAALFLTDAYFCPLHGAFEANPIAGELIHVESGRCWRQWEGKWYQLCCMNRLKVNLFPYSNCN
ncbi:TIGR02652 family protein [cyanobacterium TDX16]|nr:TIGR02652 family protein [cyanobacterium TDX16]